MKSLKEFTQIGVVVIVVGVLVYFFGALFVNVISGLYNILDQYIWSFVAGIVAFFATISIIGIVFEILYFGVVIISFLIALIASELSRK